MKDKPSNNETGTYYIFGNLSDEELKIRIKNNEEFYVETLDEKYRLKTTGKITERRIIED